MSECHRAVVREILLNQHMAVKSSHLRDGENTDRSKRSCRHRKHLPMCDISAELAVCGALQTEKRNVPRHDVPLKGSVCHLDRKASRHDLLIAHLTERKLSGSGIPQWNPIKVSFNVYGYFPSISSSYISAGTELLMSSSVTASSLTTVPMNSLKQP